MIKVYQLIILVLALLLSPICRADQSDRRLDELFSNLQIVDDIHHSQIIQARIWEIWSDAGEKTLNDMVYTGEQAMDDGEYVKAFEIFDRLGCRRNARIPVYWIVAWNYKRATCPGTST